MKAKTIAYTQLSCLALIIVLFLWWIHPDKKPIPEISTEVATTTQVALFPEVEIEAKAAYVYDVAMGKTLYEKDAKLQLPLASLTKLMSALTAVAFIPNHLLVHIETDDLREEGDTGLYPDEEWNARKLIDYSLVVSSNDGMRAIAGVAGSQMMGATTTSHQKLFVEAMNKKARELELSETYFLNQSGLDVNETLSGGYGSAKDITILVDYILKHSSNLLEATSFDKTTISSKDFSHPAQNTNKALSNIPNVIASKTGFTDLSGGNVVIAFNAGVNHPIIVSVLGSSYDGRFEDLTELVNATLSYLTSTTTLQSY